MPCGTPAVSTNVAGLADLPTAQAKPEARYVCEKLIFLLDNYDEVKNYQYEQVKNIFNKKNWTEAWLRVINSNYD